MSASVALFGLSLPILVVGKTADGILFLFRQAQGGVSNEVNSLEAGVFQRTCIYRLRELLSASCCQ